MLPLNEAFVTIQGEAYWTGIPAVFLRLQGCDVGCPWCDTKYTWHHDQNKKVPLHEVAAKLAADERFAEVNESELVAFCRPLPKHIVITGGEPADFDLHRLTDYLEHNGKFCQLETSGTSPIRVSDKTWVTVSPKIDMPGGKQVMRAALERANEIKFPVGKPKDLETLKSLLEYCEHAPRLVWLQPLSCSEKATELCIAAAITNGWRLSAQLHKYIGVR